MSYSIAFAETTRGLYATWRMFIRDARAADLFENSYAGALRSYWAVLVVLPIYGFSLGMELAYPSEKLLNYGGLVAKSGMVAATLAEFCTFALCWFVAWPLIVDRLAGYLDCERNFFRYVAAYNWMHLLSALVGAAYWTGQLGGVIHDGNLTAAALLLLSVLWTYHWFILRHALGVNGGFAAMLVALEYIVFVMLRDIIVLTAL